MQRSGFDHPSALAHNLHSVGFLHAQHSTQFGEQPIAAGAFCAVGLTDCLLPVVAQCLRLLPTNRRTDEPMNRRTDEVRMIDECATLLANGNHSCSDMKRGPHPNDKPVVVRRYLPAQIVMLTDSSLFATLLTCDSQIESTVTFDFSSNVKSGSKVDPPKCSS